MSSLLAEMVDGREYQSIVDFAWDPEQNIVSELVRGLQEIETVRGRPCLAYQGNVIKPELGHVSIDQTDDVPFIELVRTVPEIEKKVDIFLVTGGGLGHQVSRFVNVLRSRFDEIDFIIPSFCMSAGTMFAMSGDHIWMNPDGCLGPIDPQVPNRDGRRFLPAQALLAMIAEMERQGQEAAKINNGRLPWTLIRLVDQIDPKELGDVLTASRYAEDMVFEFLVKYKFRHWTVREDSGKPVTDEYRATRAREIAQALVTHERWKAHGHAISREFLWKEIQLRIDHPSPELERAIRRMWALSYWFFDRSAVAKLFLSSWYTFLRSGSGEKKESR